MKSALLVCCACGVLDRNNLFAHTHCAHEQRSHTSTSIAKNKHIKPLARAITEERNFTSTIHSLTDTANTPPWNFSILSRISLRGAHILNSTPRSRVAPHHAIRHRDRGSIPSVSIGCTRSHIKVRLPLVQVDSVGLGYSLRKVAPPRTVVTSLLRNFSSGPIRNAAGVLQRGLASIAQVSVYECVHVFSISVDVLFGLAISTQHNKQRGERPNLYIVLANRCVFAIRGSSFARWPNGKCKVLEEIEILLH